MKKYLINLFYFSCLVLIVYPLIVFSWGKIFPGKYRKNLKYREASTGQLDQRLRDADTTKNIDLLILGSSHAYRGYDPRIFKKEGIKVFNLGSSAQTPIQTEILFNQYLSQFNPKHIIIDVYPALLASNGIESSLDLIANDCLDKNFAAMFLKQKNIIVINAAIYSSINNILKPSKAVKKIASPDKYIVGGFTESYKKYKAKAGKDIKFDVEISDMQMDALVRIINKIKSNNLTYTLVQSPVTKEKYALTKNNVEMDRVISKLGTYYNFNKMLTLTDNYFYDDHHLNQYGVVVFNQRLLETIDIKPLAKYAKN
ncbi:hypothetical protein [Pedobacter psychroterrae]|uniref:SGNH/GDSL hydrolase family protein n=1 Tax=Pedobacter psychroterrae TaxID=2530453 RepID=A0A4R0NRJ2_9SPHI|nr:hypothetical protein [Pedobacter psychroterrae]TCD02668.1 hypothetical protein EZ437_01390 [Pedobacter psychroterrae]